MQRALKPQSTAHTRFWRAAIPRRLQATFGRKHQTRSSRLCEKFGVDADTCTGDHSCIRLSGCPSLTIAANPDPLRKDPVATVVESCVGCGLCGEVAHAARLCPSFFRTDIISNPHSWDRFKAQARSAIIGFLQRRMDRRLAGITA